MTTKRWDHTTVSCPGLTLVANFSTIATDSHRLTTLVFADGVACDIQSYPADRCRTSTWRSAVTFADSSLVERGRGFELVVVDPVIELRAKVSLEPIVASAQLHNLAVGAGGVLHWSVHPRLVAHGTIEYRGQTHAVVGAPAYRDRNWGTFAFGDVAWDWGYVLPDDREAPFAVVFARMLDRTRTQVLDQYVLVWAGTSLLGSFRGREIAFETTGQVAGPYPTAPAALALCRPGHASDIPRQLTVTASSARGEVIIEFAHEATARLLVPRDHRRGTSAIHESLGRARANGVLDDCAIDVAGHAFVESVHA